MTQSPARNERLRKIVAALRNKPIEPDGRVNLGSQTFIFIDDVTKGTNTHTVHRRSNEHDAPIWGIKLIGFDQVKITLYYEKDSKRFYVLAQGRTYADHEPWQIPGREDTCITVETWPHSEQATYHIDTLPDGAKHYLYNVLGIS